MIHLYGRRMRQGDMIKIDFLLADCDRVFTQTLFSPVGKQIIDLMPLLNNELKQAWKESGAISINAEQVSEHRVLNEDTRIMILKKLINDPKDLRRKRARLSPIKKVKT